MLKRNFDDEDLRVGFGQDLRDEALIGFATMLILLPVILRSIFISLEPHLQYDPATNNGLGLTSHNYGAWLSLVGTELAKAVPFVDWAEIFHVEGDPFIAFDKDAAAYQCVIFAMRVIVDLVLLAALLQAVSIVSRTAKQKEMFFDDGTLSQLDPFIEPKELAHLAAGKPGQWRIRNKDEFDAFPEYDEDRLVRLSIAEDDEPDTLAAGEEYTAVRFIARQLADRDEQRPPEYLLFLHARKDRLNEERIDVLLEKIETQNSPLNIDDMLNAHSVLNNKNRLRETRLRITRLLAANTENPRAITGLAQILTGLGAKRPERRGEIREVALSGLGLPAISGSQIARSAIVMASLRDAKATNKEQAQALLDSHEDWIKIEEYSKQILANQTVEDEPL